MGGLKIPLVIGLGTALCILFYELTNLLLIYRYFKFDYYLVAVALIFLLVGVLIARKKSDSMTPKDSGVLIPTIQLTNKEFEILRLIGNGKTNKEIAAVNYTELSTVKTHINNLYAKLGIRNRREAMEVFDSQYRE